MSVERGQESLIRFYESEHRSALYEWRRRVQTRLGNALVLWMARRYRHLPERAGHRMGEALGAAMRWISPRHYRIVMQNLHLAFGVEKNEEEMAAIAAACYRHLGKCMMEFIRLPAMSREEIKRIADLRGGEHLQAALDQGKGAILLTGHLGNWEMVGARIAADGYLLNVIARAQRDDAITDYVRRTREVMGMRVFHREVAVRSTLAALRKNEIVGILLDQNAGDDGVFVDFFGHLASTAAGAAVFALRTGAPVLPTFGWRNQDNRHTTVVEAPVPLIKTGNYQQDIIVNTAQFTKIIEQKIRAHPEQWFWLHKRWKSRPTNESKGLTPNP